MDSWTEPVSYNYFMKDNLIEKTIQSRALANVSQGNQGLSSPAVPVFQLMSGKAPINYNMGGKEEKDEVLGHHSDIEEEEDQEEDDDDDAGLSIDEMNKIDRTAWAIAIAASVSIRDPDWLVERRAGGENEGLDANTRMPGDRRIVIDYYPRNDSFSDDDADKRLAQMTALFNHELTYHANKATTDKVNTPEETSQEKEHDLMFDPATRDEYVVTAYTALYEFRSNDVRKHYLVWWLQDVLQHIERSEVSEDVKQEANIWVKQKAKDIKQMILNNEFS